MNQISTELKAIEQHSYLVGGAVRDQLLDRRTPSNDRDWVVVGQTPKIMLAAGFQQVGNHFPVYLHPISQEEYALARTESKSGTGHQAFNVAFGPDITLETDLQRRDLTINAIALDSEGRVIDPFNGQQDIHDRQLRHVSEAFREDPLRVFRAARFAAQLHEFSFTVADETLELMTAMALSGELSELSPERVWQETAKALTSPAPEVYFRTLKQCDALQSWLPEVDQLYGIPQRADYHPEIDTGIHIEMSLAAAAKLSDALATRYAVLTHDLGKGITPKNELPSHRGHEAAGLPLVKTLSERLKAPKACQDLALKTCEYHLHIHRVAELKASTLLKVFYRCDAFRKPEAFAQLLLACKADAQGRKGATSAPYPQMDFCWQALERCRQVSITDVTDEQERTTLDGAAIRQRLDQARISAIKHYQRHQTA